MEADAAARPQSAAARRLKPLFDRVLISKAVPETKTAGGLLLPEAAAAVANSGTVVSVGPGARGQDGELIPVAVKEGDSVLLPEYGGAKVTLGDEEMYIYRDNELLGVLE